MEELASAMLKAMGMFVFVLLDSLDKIARR